MTALQSLPRSRFEVVLNGETVMTYAKTLSDLIGEVGLADARIATAVNGSFVRESQRSEVVLQARDAIEIVSPRQGG